jgi:uncharacterized protein (TIGR02246 family)
MTSPQQHGATAAQLSIEGLGAVPGPDQAGITATIGALLAGFQQRDAGLLTGVYTDDADWVNAFGSVKKGSAEIIAYLRGLFADQNFDDGQLAAPPTSTLRRVTDDVVIISTHLQVTGQGLVGGGTIALRDNHSLHILQKQPSGQWQIISEMFSDARPDHSYINHS